MKFRCIMLLAVLCTVLLAGCAETKDYKTYRDEVSSWSYGHRLGVVWKDWSLDLLDMMSLEVGAGECLGVNVQPTEFAQAGVFFGNVMKLGYRDRALGFYKETRKEGGLTWFYYRDVMMQPLVGTETLMLEEYRPRLYQGFPIRHNKEWHYLDVGAEVGLLFFDTSAHVSPKEALDFAFSTVCLPFELIFRPIFGSSIPEIDFCDDDTASRLRKKYDVELIHAPPGLPPIEYFNEINEQPY